MNRTTAGEAPLRHVVGRACASLLLLCLDLCAYPAFSLKLWTADDGLPQNIIRGVRQTQDGYLWLATLNGLVRFDGVHFTIAGSYGAADYISRAIASAAGDPCPEPWTVGGTVEPVCTNPDLRPGVVDPMAMYHGNPADLHCYLVGADLHQECRVDPKLG